MLVQMILTSALSAVPFNAVPASDRHAEVWAQMTAESRLGTPALEVAQQMPPPPSRPSMPGPQGEAGMPQDMHHEMHHGMQPGMQPGMPFRPPWLRGLALSEAQDDKVFGILYAQMPTMREQMRDLRKAREALHELVRSENFSEDRASALTAAIGRSVAALALIHARTEASVWQVLTPEQRKQAAEQRMGPPQGWMPGERGGPRPMR